jgi:hypothetical protein
MGRGICGGDGSEGGDTASVNPLAPYSKGEGRAGILCILYSCISFIEMAAFI